MCCHGQRTALHAHARSQRLNGRGGGGARAGDSATNRFARAAFLVDREPSHARAMPYEQPGVISAATTGRFAGFSRTLSVPCVFSAPMPTRVYVCIWVIISGHLGSVHLSCPSFASRIQYTARTQKQTFCPRAQRGDTQTRIPCNAIPGPKIGSAPTGLRRACQAYICVCSWAVVVVSCTVHFT